MPRRSAAPGLERTPRARLAAWLAVWLVAACASAPPTTDDALTSALARVDEQLDASTEEMASCFRRELGAGADQLNGRIVVRFEIDADGLVLHLQILESALGDPKADLCVADTVRRVFFEVWVGRDPVRLTKPFAFFAGR